RFPARRGGSPGADLHNVGQDEILPHLEGSCPLAWLPLDDTDPVAKSGSRGTRADRGVRPTTVCATKIQWWIRSCGLSFLLLIDPCLRHAYRQFSHARDDAHTLGHADRSARVQRIEQVRA